MALAVKYNIVEGRVILKKSGKILNFMGVVLGTNPLGNVVHVRVFPRFSVPFFWGVFSIGPKSGTIKCLWENYDAWQEHIKQKEQEHFLNWQYDNPRSIWNIIDAEGKVKQ